MTTPARKPVKKPPNMFFVFRAEFQAQARGGSVMSVSRAASAEWRQMSDKQKQPYADKAAELMRQYRAQKDQAERRQRAELWHRIGKMKRAGAVGDIDPQRLDEILETICGDI
ncbi:hypothetical protein H4R18_005396 [Coemansia javaensis]|uniref:HMG box domain-containing protein n=1 Tax=Coemansia javaensis TaxID=2761396 RepID=A0A9W8LEV4_9FUNG|nr:hypothetical protein H4R18_005396 [Coemansia javaensis]